MNFICELAEVKVNPAGYMCFKLWDFLSAMFVTERKENVEKTS